MDITVVEGKRSMARQAELYELGRTKGRIPEDIVTNAQPGQSAHNFGLAIDVAPTEYMSKPGWNAGGEKWMQLHQIARDMGLTAGIKVGTGRIDWPHVEVKDWKQKKDWARTALVTVAVIAAIAAVVTHA